MANALILETDLLGDIAICQLGGSLTMTAYALLARPRHDSAPAVRSAARSAAGSNPVTTAVADDGRRHRSRPERHQLAIRGVVLVDVAHLERPTVA